MTLTGERDSHAVSPPVPKAPGRSEDFPRAPETLVVDVGPGGPIFGGRVQRRRVDPDTFVPGLSRGDRVLVTMLSLAWLAAFVIFWRWWFQPEHRLGWAGLVLNSVLLFYITSVAGYFLSAIRRIRRVNPDLPIPSARVAFVVTRAPSEEWAVAHKTLSAMLAQEFPYAYDVWLCDEDPSPETLRWCRDHNVHVATRRDIPGYHRTTWPRRTRCKEGNLAWFYDNWGFEDYDIVAQLDCDHVPTPTYLAAIVRPFSDPAIGYVAAPSVCDANAANSWSARGRLYREAPLHGPLQMGHNKGLAPVCIGSHYAVRTRALLDVGGLGPDLAEDFSTTFLLQSAGWEGAFAHDAEAHGDGPITFADMLTQEYQWSRSLVLLLYDLVPHHFGRLTRRVRLRFLYATAYYPLLMISMIAGLALAPIAVLTDHPWVNVNYFEFIALMGLVSVWPLLVILLLRRRKLLRPANAPVLSWELALFALARWPYVARGVLAATFVTKRGRTTTFKVTPKMRKGLEPLPTWVMLPYIAVSAGLSVVAIYGIGHTSRVGYVFLCLVGAAWHAAVAALVPVLHMIESARAAQAGFRAFGTAWLPLLWGLATAGLLAYAAAGFPTYALGFLT